jgi:hypothetical protein
MTYKFKNNFLVLMAFHKKVTTEVEFNCEMLFSIYVGLSAGDRVLS